MGNWRITEQGSIHPRVPERVWPGWAQSPDHQTSHWWWGTSEVTPQSQPAARQQVWSWRNFNFPSCAGDQPYSKRAPAGTTYNQGLRYRILHLLSLNFIQVVSAQPSGLSGSLCMASPTSKESKASPGLILPSNIPNVHSIPACRSFVKAPALLRDLTGAWLPAAYSNLSLTSQPIILYTEVVCGCLRVSKHTKLALFSDPKNTPGFFTDLLFCCILPWVKRMALDHTTRELCYTPVSTTGPWMSARLDSAWGS